MPDSFQFKCPFCEQDLECPFEAQGVVVKCPSCDNEIVPDEEVDSQREKATQMVDGHFDTLESKEKPTIIPPVIPPVIPPALEWHYEKNGKRKGPVSKTNIEDMIKSGELTYGNMVWTIGQSNWILVEESEFKHLLGSITPPPLTGDKVNNTIVWILAFAPFIGLLIEVIVALAVYSNEGLAQKAIKDRGFWYITVLLNTVLCLWDEKMLKRAGYNTSKFGWSWWLVPVYLYQRTKNLKQNYAYFIAWIIICLIVVIGQ